MLDLHGLTYENNADNMSLAQENDKTVCISSETDRVYRSVPVIAIAAVFLVLYEMFFLHTERGAIFRRPATDRVDV